MARKRKVNYPVAKTATKRAPAPGTDASIVRPNLATIDLTAGAGRAGLTVGDRVRIEAAGLYSGETAVIERLIGGVIPAALVRTEADRTRRVRTIDLVPLKSESRPPTDTAAAE
ncbi:MAG: hypothetical protein QOH61_836 [Chloroflexota bacterium]|nr:hypothetical protein [Chloroflexota bacterium]